MEECNFPSRRNGFYERGTAKRGNDRTAARRGEAEGGWRVEGGKTGTNGGKTIHSWGGEERVIRGKKRGEGGEETRVEALGTANENASSIAPVADPACEMADPQRKWRPLIGQRRVQKITRRKHPRALFLLFLQDPGLT